jgi:hypothetical protein
MQMGFIEDVEEILKAGEDKKEEIQTLLFSATMPKWIKSLCDRFLKTGHKFVDLVGDEVQKVCEGGGEGVEGGKQVLGTGGKKSMRDWFPEEGAQVRGHGQRRGAEGV